MFPYIIYLIAVILLAIKVAFKLSNVICHSNVCLTGKVAIVTGGNAGIGYQTALGLASRGCKVIIASHVPSPGIVEAIIKHTRNPNIVYKSLNLGSLDSVRSFAEDINTSEDRLDILINNMTVTGYGNLFSKDDLQLEMQINHFGPFLLTHLLIGLLKKSEPSRIIFVASVSAYIHKLCNATIINDPMKFAKNSNSLLANIDLYSDTKLCNIIASNGFAHRLINSKVTSNAVHPGLINTSLFDSILDRYSIALGKLFRILTVCFTKTPFEGAQNTILLAVSNKLETTTGKFFMDGTSIPMPKIAQNPNFCNAVWNASEECVKLRPEEKL